METEKSPTAVPDATQPAVSPAGWCLLHVPRNLDPRQVEAQAKLDAGGVRLRQTLLLRHERSPCGANLSTLVAEPVARIETTYLRGS